MLQSACNTSLSVSKYLSGRSLCVCGGKWLYFLCARYHCKGLQAHPTALLAANLLVYEEGVSVVYVQLE